MSGGPEPDFGTSEWCRCALSFHLTTGRCSSVLAAQLVAGFWSRDLDFHSIANEIGALDGSEHSRSGNTKPAAPFRRGRLKGLMHKHFFQPTHLLRNVMDYWFDPTRTTSPKLDRLIESTLDDPEVPNAQKMDYIAHKFMIGGLENRSRERRLTGEWIIHKRQDGINFYLALASHTESEEDVATRVERCLIDFPELAPLLKPT